MGPWNERGEAMLRRDGTLHHPDSAEGRRIGRDVYGENADSIRQHGTIYAPDGTFHLHNSNQKEKQ